MYHREFGFYIRSIAIAHGCQLPITRHGCYKIVNKGYHCSAPPTEYTTEGDGAKAEVYWHVYNKPDYSSECCKLSFQFWRLSILIPCRSLFRLARTTRILSRTRMVAPSLEWGHKHKHLSISLPYLFHSRKALIDVLRQNDQLSYHELLHQLRWVTPNFTPYIQ